VLRFDAVQSYESVSRLLQDDGLFTIASVLPAEHSVLNVPVAAVVDHFSTPELPIFAQFSRLGFEAPQHSPPDLYTLHSSLLI
jgi:hypothetical protein